MWYYLCEKPTVSLKVFFFSVKMWQVLFFLNVFQYRFFFLISLSNQIHDTIIVVLNICRCVIVSHWLSHLECRVMTKFVASQYVPMREYSLLRILRCWVPSIWRRKYQVHMRVSTMQNKILTLTIVYWFSNFPSLCACLIASSRYWNPTFCGLPLTYARQQIVNKITNFIFLKRLQIFNKQTNTVLDRYLSASIYTVNLNVKEDVFIVVIPLPQIRVLCVLSYT